MNKYNHKHDECCHHCCHDISYDDYFNVGEHILVCCHDKKHHDHCCCHEDDCYPTHSPAACKQHNHPPKHDCCYHDHYHHCHPHCCDEHHFLFDADHDGFVEGAIIKRPIF